jgi:hypothetical protein
MTSAWGQSAVQYYYDHSEPFADSIKESPILQSLARVVLYPVAGLLYGLQWLLGE